MLGTLTQAIPPEEYRGRVQAAFNLMSSVPLALAVGVVGLLLQLVSSRLTFIPSGLPDLWPGILFYNEANSQWIVFAGFGIALLLTAWLAVNMLKGIDEGVRLSCSCPCFELEVRLSFQCGEDGFQPDRELTDRMFAEGMKGDLIARGARMGLVLDVGGYYKNVFTLAPSFEITEDEIDLGVELLEQLIRRCAPGRV